MLHVTRGLLGLLACFFIGLSAQAQNSADSLKTEIIYSGLSAQGEKSFVVLYAENQLWHLEEILQHADGWQDVVSRRYYRTYQEALASQRKLQGRYSRLQAVNPLAHEISGELVLKGGSIWPTTQTWSWEWEQKYAQWLLTSMNSDFFKKYGVATDCADVAYAARWIFARIHGLPVANRLAATKTLFTNQSLRPEWAKLPTAANWYEDKRFFAALNYLLDSTYTHTLMRDSYPVAIQADNFLPGVHFLNLRDVSGHTQLVHRVDLSGGAIPFMIVQSTVPRKVRAVNESLFWGPDQAKKDVSGFLRIRWPKIVNGVYSLEAPENMPGYSLEQYDPAFIREEKRPFSMEVMLRLKPDLNFLSVLEKGFHNLQDMLVIRQDLVNEGYRQCPSRSCKPDSSLYDDWSTPSRDQHILELMNQVKMITRVPLDAELTRKINAAYLQEMQKVALTLDGEEYKMKSIWFAWAYQSFSSDPNDEPARRWGLTPEIMALSLKQKLQKSLEARKAKVSITEDNLLRRQLKSAETYCEFFSEDQCRRFKEQALQEPVTLLSQKKTLEEWLDWTLWLNADPRQSRENQWGGLQSKASFQKLPGNLEEFQVTENGIGYLKTLDGKKRVGRMEKKGLEDFALPAGFAWDFFTKNGSTAWAVMPGQLLRLDLKTQTQKINSLQNLGTFRVLGVEGDILKLASADEFLNVQWQEGAAQILWREPATQVRALGKSTYVGLQQDGWKLFDFKNPQPQVIAVPLDLSAVKIAFVDNARYVGLTVYPDSWMIEKSTGVMTKLPDLGLFAKWSEGLTKVVAFRSNFQGLRVVTLDSQFQVVKEQNLGDMGWVSGDFIAAVTLSNGSGKGSIYRFHGEDLEEMPLLKDEVGILDISGKWMQTSLNKESTKMRIRNLETAQIVYEGGPLMMLALGRQHPQEMNYGMVLAEIENIRVVSLRNAQEPALLTGAFFGEPGANLLVDFTLPNMSLGPLISVKDGVVLSYQGILFWVRFGE